MQYLVRQWNNYEGIFTLLSGPTIWRARDGPFSIGSIILSCGMIFFFFVLVSCYWVLVGKTYIANGVQFLFSPQIVHCSPNLWSQQRLPGPTFAAHVRHPKFCILSLFIQLTTNKFYYLSKGGGNNPYDMTCMEPIVLLASTKVETLAQGTSEANDETFGPPDDVQPTSSTDQLESNTHEIVGDLHVQHQGTHPRKLGMLSFLHCALYT